MKRRTALRLALVALLSLTLGACGFTLRGSAPAAGGSAVQLVSAEPAGALAGIVRDALQSAGLSGASTGSTWQLQLGTETLVSRPGSVNSRARAAQHDLELSVEIALSRGATTVFGPARLATQRSYYEDLSTIAGSSEEVALLQQEMRQELAQQVLRRLRAALADQGA
jgi:outer membrane lipopolysaccharide assembly protein LptE/RlpB